MHFTINSFERVCLIICKDFSQTCDVILEETSVDPFKVLITVLGILCYVAVPVIADKPWFQFIALGSASGS